MNELSVRKGNPSLPPEQVSARRRARLSRAGAHRGARTGSFDNAASRHGGHAGRLSATALCPSGRVLYQSTFEAKYRGPRRYGGLPQQEPDLGAPFIL